MSNEVFNQVVRNEIEKFIKDGGVKISTRVDNVANDSVASTAFAKSQDAVLAREPNQGVAMTYASSGSNGIVVADNNNIDFGTGNFTLVWKGSLLDWTPSVDTRLLYKFQDNNNYWD